MCIVWLAPQKLLFLKKNSMLEKVSTTFQKETRNLRCAFFIPWISALFFTALARVTGETLYTASGLPCWMLWLVELLLSWVLYLSHADLKTLTIAAFTLEVSSKSLVPSDAKLKRRRNGIKHQENRYKNNKATATIIKNNWIIMILVEAAKI